MPVFVLRVGVDSDELDKFCDFRELLNVYAYEK